jgi:hypothetical protein
VPFFSGSDPGYDYWLLFTYRVWLGWAYFSIKCPRPGTKGFTSMCLWFFVLNLHKKCQGIAKDARAVLTHARSYTQETFFGPPSGTLVVPPSILKPSPKHQNLTSVGERPRSPFFLCPIQNLKAVTMGTATARVPFWPNSPTHPCGSLSSWLYLWMPFSKGL